MIDAEKVKVFFGGQEIKGLGGPIAFTPQQRSVDLGVREVKGTFEFRIDGPRAEEFMKAFDLAPTEAQLSWGRRFLRRVIRSVGPRVTKKWLNGFGNGELGHPATEAWDALSLWWQKRERRRLRQLRKKRRGWA